MLLGGGTDELLGYFSVTGKFSEKAPYPVEFTWRFTTSGDNMEFNGWRESDKGIVYSLHFDLKMYVCTFVIR